MKSKTIGIDFSFVLASSVHDMKNSLGMLMNTVNDVIKKYPPQNESHANSYAVLEYEAVRINSELIQLLSLYHLDHDHVRVQIDKHCVIDILNDQIARNYCVFQSHKITVNLVCDESLQGYFDADLIGGVVNNLLVNCARYCKNSLRIVAQQEQDYLCIVIEDDGPGYPQDMLDAAAADSEIHPGFAGGRPHLGLLFAHKVALMHQTKTRHGFIKLSNGGQLGGGCFNLYLP
jgi:K+-sensing histidine kinase KdpD